MSKPTDEATLTVALLGNPNTGKSTLFSALVGSPQRVGNYPGVTVEKKMGRTRCGDAHLTVIDLPGTYSLVPRSRDEMVTVDVLLGRLDDVGRPDVIICIVDATNLQRNLYLVSQALELERPLIIVLNKMDVVRERGMGIDVSLLRRRLAVPVVEMQAHRRVGLEELKQALVGDPEHRATEHASPLPPAVCREVAHIRAVWEERQRRQVPSFLAERLLLDTGGYLEHSDFGGDDGQLLAEVRSARKRLESDNCPVPAVETTSRYQWVDRILQDAVKPGRDDHASTTDWMDRILTHRVVGVVLFTCLMIIVFQAIFSWAAPLQEVMDHGVVALDSWITRTIPEGVLQSLLADGVIAGVGAVLAFLPQIAMLFLFVALLEECGYMSRAAYLMDGLMSRVGLSGKSFIPLLSSFACAVPGIMATRVIENGRDRLLTILVAPLMSCSARLPIYILLIAAFIPDRRFLGGWLGLQGITMLALYGLGIVTAICVTKALRLTWFRGETPPFVMELPDYRIPSLGIVVRRVTEQCWVFLRSAGTLILSVTVIVWALAYFPHSPQVEADVRGAYATQLSQLDDQIRAAQAASAERGPAGAGEAGHAVVQLQQQRTALESTISNRVAGAYMEQSVLGHLGRLVAPLVRPLGWDWRIGCSVIASFPAREVVIGAMGVIYNLGDGQSEQSTTLRQELAAETWPDTGRPIFTIPVALSIMVFFALCAQCAATLVVIRNETGSFKWSLITFAYMTCLAYVGALLTYHVGTWMMQ